MRSNALLKNAVLYIGLLALFSLVITYQMKSSLETVRAQRTLAFYVPFDRNEIKCLAEECRPLHRSPGTVLARDYVPDEVITGDRSCAEDPCLLRAFRSE